MQRIAAIAAMSENRVIGKDNQLLWKLPDDWANFWRIAEGKPFVMGRKSYQAEDALISDYRNVVISSRSDLELPGHTSVVDDPERALELLSDEAEILILGGGSIFQQLMPHVNYLYLTIVHHIFDGDTYFPEVDWDRWQLVRSVYHDKDEEHAYSFSLNEYEPAI